MLCDKSLMGLLGTGMVFWYMKPLEVSRCLTSRDSLIGFLYGKHPEHRSCAQISPNS